MANYNNLKTAIQDVIKANGNQEITGEIMQNALLSMINSLGAGYQFVSVATPETNPGTPDQKVFYIANGKGTYVNFGGLVVDEDEVVLLVYDDAWKKLLSGIASNSKLTELDREVIYDVSAHNNNAVFESLQSILSNSDLKSLIPTSIRCGGMSIRFRQTSDNKYVQYRLLTPFWSTDLSDWQDYGFPDKTIKLTGISPNGASSNVTKVGDVYYNTTSKLLRYCIEWLGDSMTSKYETMPFYDGAIYTYNKELYLYDGNDLIHATETSIKNAVNQLSETVYGEKYDINSIPTYPTPREFDLPSIKLSEIGKVPVYEQIDGSRLAQLDVTNAIKVAYPTFVSTIGAGSCFLDKNGLFLGGYTETEKETGTYKEIDVPKDAKYFLIALNSVLNSGDYKLIVYSIKDSIIDVKDKVNKEFYRLVKVVDIIPMLESGYIDLSSGIGTTIDINRHTSEHTKSAIVKCEQDDVFYLSGYSGVKSRLWGFLDANNLLLSVAKPDMLITDEILIKAPKNAKTFIYQTTFERWMNSVCKNLGIIPCMDIRLEMLENPEPDVNINEEYLPDGYMLLAMKTNIPNRNQPFNFGYLFCRWNDDKQLYYGQTLTDAKKIASPNVNNKNLKFAISPKNGDIIMATRNTRGSITIFNSKTNELVELPFNSAKMKPMGWLYNSGCCFDNDENGNEICLFAEYAQSPATSGGFNVWRGVYPYTSEDNWSIVMYVPYVGDDANGITHFHQVRRDPWTGIIYLTSGDASNESKWWYSKDHGKTFTLLTTGATSGYEEHICRCINFIFAKDKIYFATDHGTNHCLNSVERDADTGIIKVDSRVKITDLPDKQATNFLCYSNSPKGIFMYDRWDIGYGSPTAPIKVQFYSLETNTLIDVTELDINDTWGGHRGGCYVDYLNTTMTTPAMGFDLNSPCIFALNNPDISKIGTIFYDIFAKVVHTI